MEKKVSLITCVVCCIILLIVNSNVRRWKDLRTIDWDVISYYDYLPAKFIHHDLSLEFIRSNAANYSNKHQYWPEIAPNGAYVIKVTMGLSYLYSPFFFLAHKIALEKGYVADGFSLPYHKYIHLSGVFYLMIGLFFLRALLLKWFNEFTVSVLLAVILFGTNLFYYGAWEAAMSHAYSFSLIAAFLLFACRWHLRQKYIDILVLGILFGLITLIRPVNCLIILFFVFFSVKERKDITVNFLKFFKNWQQLVLFFILSFLVLLPQFIYWKSQTGHWLFFPYTHERFFFDHPHILKGLFGFRKGWYIYTPCMFLATLGFITLFRHYKQLFFASFITMICVICVVFSWWSWWYGGSFGIRALIDFYPLMALPLGAMLEVFQKNKVYLVSFCLLLFFCIVLNVVNVFQYSRGLIHWDSMTRDAYFYSFGKFKMDEAESRHFNSLLKSPDYDKERTTGEE